MISYGVYAMIKFADRYGSHAGIEVGWHQGSRPVHLTHDLTIPHDQRSPPDVVLAANMMARRTWGKLLSFDAVTEPSIQRLQTKVL